MGEKLLMAKPRAGRKALRLKIPGTTPTSGLRSPLKRASILPRRNLDLWTDPGDTYVETTNHDLFHNPANKLSFTPLNELPKHPQQAIVPEDPTSSATTSETPKVRALLNGPGRRIQKAHRPIVAGKKVSWDPSIVATGPVIIEKPTKFDMSIKAVQVEPKIQRVREPVQQTSAGSLEIAEAVQIIKRWTRDDTAKLKNVLQALKHLGFDDEEGKAEPQSPRSNEVVEVVPTKIRSLNPRVPEFKSSAYSRTMICPEKQSQQHSISKEDCIVDTLKENIPVQQSVATSSPRSGTVRKRSICDDYQDHGRTVAAFDHWYAEKQLLEFMKKYPMTGKKAPVIKKQASIRQNQHEIMKAGPTSGRHAAMIQQRLEFLLWKAKEKEALKYMLTKQAGL